MDEQNDHEVTVKPNQSPAEMMQSALDRGVDLDKLKQFMDLQKEWEANEAKKEFNKAMARVHSKIPTVVKNTMNPQTHSKYAQLDSVINKTKPVYTAEGFFPTFYEGDGAPDHHVRVMVDVGHKSGHSITRFYDSPIDDKGIKGQTNKTPTHARASAFSYGRRYLMSLIFNIPTGDDDDGNAAGGAQSIGDKELSYLRDALNATGDKESSLCKILKIEDLETMPTTMYAKARAVVDARLKEKGAQ